MLLAGMPARALPHPRLAVLPGRLPRAAGRGAQLVPCAKKEKKDKDKASNEEPSLEGSNGNGNGVATPKNGAAKAKAPKAGAEQQNGAAPVKRTFDPKRRRARLQRLWAPECDPNASTRTRTFGARSVHVHVSPESAWMAHHLAWASACACTHTLSLWLAN